MATSDRSLRIRFWLDAGLALTTASLSGLTLIWHDWLESFGLDPDHHSGEAEVLVVLALLTCSVGLAVAARLEWKKTMAASTSLASEPNEA